MKKILFLFVFVFSINHLHSQQIQNKTELNFANSVLNDYLKKSLINEAPKPSEYGSARELYLYDIDDDGDKDIIAFYTLEGFGGGNNWQHFITIFVMENSKVKLVDELVLFGDSWKKYHSGELIEFKNGYVYYKLYGSDFETNERIIKTIGITIEKDKIVTTEPL